MRPGMTTTPTMAAAATISPTSDPGSVSGLPTHGHEQARPRTDRHRCGLSRLMCSPRTSPRRGSPLSVVLFYRLDEAYSEDGEDDTAFGGGRSLYMGFFIGLAPLRRCSSRSGSGCGHCGTHCDPT
jgi:hypothetical protein